MANSLLGAVQREPIVGTSHRKTRGVAGGVPGIASLDLTRLSVAEAAREMRAPVAFCADSGALSLNFTWRYASRP